MKFQLCPLLLALTAGVSVPEVSPQSVVLNLYKSVVARHPVGIPQGRDKAVIAPLLSRALLNKLDTAKACERDYFKQHPEKDSKPAFPWLELGLFSGANEEAIPSKAEVINTNRQENGSYRVVLRLIYKESYKTYGRPPDPANTFHWQVAAVVNREGGRFVVDDILFFRENSNDVETRLSDTFTGCDGSRWVGDK
jgi:hypothetical protein